MADPYVHEVGRVKDLDACTITVGVDYDTVTLRAPFGPARLTQAQAEEFAQLFVSACWQAGQNVRQMHEETHEADGGDTMHDGCPIEAVFSADRFPCTFERGHDGPHSFGSVPVSP
jgi:hypothetical protein